MVREKNQINRIVNEECTNPFRRQWISSFLYSIGVAFSGYGGIVRRKQNDWSIWWCFFLFPFLCFFINHQCPKIIPYNLEISSSPSIIYTRSCVWFYFALLLSITCKIPLIDCTLMRFQHISLKIYKSMTTPKFQITYNYLFEYKSEYKPVNHKNINQQ